MAIPMELIGVRVKMPTNAPILVLREVEGSRRTVPIYIGGPEAHAIDLALSGITPERPMTHDLFQTVVEGLGAHLDRVVVTDLIEGTFFAEVFFTNAEGEELKFSARPSDAIALAARREIPIFAESELLEEAGIEDAEEPEDSDANEMVEQLRKFLDEVSPEDFKP